MTSSTSTTPFFLTAPPSSSSGPAADSIDAGFGGLSRDARVDDGNAKETARKEEEEEDEERDEEPSGGRTTTSTGTEGDVRTMMSTKGNGIDLAPDGKVTDVIDNPIVNLARRWMSIDDDDDDINPVKNILSSIMPAFFFGGIRNDKRSETTVVNGGGGPGKAAIAVDCIKDGDDEDDGVPYGLRRLTQQQQQSQTQRPSPVTNDEVGISVGAMTTTATTTTEKRPIEPNILGGGRAMKGDDGTSFAKISSSLKVSPNMGIKSLAINKDGRVGAFMAKNNVGGGVPLTLKGKESAPSLDTKIDVTTVDDNFFASVTKSISVAGDKIVLRKRFPLSVKMPASLERDGNYVSDPTGDDSAVSKVIESIRPLIISPPSSPDNPLKGKEIFFGGGTNKPTMVGLSKKKSFLESTSSPTTLFFKSLPKDKLSAMKAKNDSGSISPMNNSFVKSFTKGKLGEIRTFSGDGTKTSSMVGLSSMKSVLESTKDGATPKKSFGRGNLIAMKAENDGGEKKTFGKIPNMLGKSGPSIGRAGPLPFTKKSSFMGSSTKDVDSVGIARLRAPEGVTSINEVSSPKLPAIVDEIGGDGGSKTDVWVVSKPPTANDPLSVIKNQRERFEVGRIRNPMTATTFTALAAPFVERVEPRRREPASINLRPEDFAPMTKDLTAEEAEMNDSGSISPMNNSFVKSFTKGKLGEIRTISGDGTKTSNMVGLSSMKSVLESTMDGATPKKSFGRGNLSAIKAENDGGSTRPTKNSFLNSFTKGKLGEIKAEDGPLPPRLPLKGMIVSSRTNIETRLPFSKKSFISNKIEPEAPSTRTPASGEKKTFGKIPNMLGKSGPSIGRAGPLPFTKKFSFMGSSKDVDSLDVARLRAPKGVTSIKEVSSPKVPEIEEEIGGKRENKALQSITLEDEERKNSTKEVIVITKQLEDERLAALIQQEKILAEQKQTVEAARLEQERLTAMTEEAQVLTKQLEEERFAASIEQEKILADQRQIVESARLEQARLATLTKEAQITTKQLEDERFAAFFEQEKILAKQRQIVEAARLEQEKLAAVAENLRQEIEQFKRDNLVEVARLETERSERERFAALIKQEMTSAEQVRRVAEAAWSDEERVVEQASDQLMVDSTGKYMSRNYGSDVDLVPSSQSISAAVSLEDDEGVTALSTMSLADAKDEPSWRIAYSILGAFVNAEEGLTFPLLHIGYRIQSSAYGTTHECFLIQSIEDSSEESNRDNIAKIFDDGSIKFSITPCIAKRPWSLPELNATVPSKVMAFERRQRYYDAIEEQVQQSTLEPWELDNKAAEIRRYYEVEIHIFQKFERKRELLAEQRRKIRQQEEAGRERGIAKFTDNPSAEDIKTDHLIAVPKFLRVYPDDGSGGPNSEDAIPEYGATGADVWGKSLNGLSGSHEWLVYEGRFESEVTLLEAMERLRLTNFGNALDLDPPRVGLDNDSLKFDAPGSIANTLAADVFSVAFIICQLLFDVPDGVLNEQLTSAGFDLDLWLRQTQTAAGSNLMRLIDALDYLRQRRGLWSLLKTAIRPNPLRKKITADSLRQFNEVMDLKNGNIKWTKELAQKVAREESYLESVLNLAFGDIGGISVTTEATKEMGWDNENLITSQSYRDEDSFDITRVPYTLKPRSKTTVSVLSKLSKESDQSIPRVDPIEKVVSRVQLVSESGDYTDITRLKFTPTRKSLLTDMLTSYSSKRIVGNSQQQRNEALFRETSYDTSRSNFEGVSPRISDQNAIEAVIQSSYNIPGGRASADSMKLVQIFAPAGKLGVEVDTPEYGGPAYVSSISNSSPLLGRIFLGDMIIAVDNMDVQQLVADDVSKILLVKSTNTRRLISVLRKFEGPEQPSYPSSGKGGTQAHASLTNDKRFEEVEQWLMSYLPQLIKEDAVNYCNTLIDDGFDSLDMLAELMEDDIHFMKKAHKRVMLRRLFNATTSSSAFNEQIPPAKKVYTVDEALGVAARKGIEATIAEEKRLASETRLVVANNKAMVEQKNKGEKKEQIVDSKSCPKANEEKNDPMRDR
ncbi:hypothetical protein ACHAXA_000092 [Cyclostephanos tholiformis]|uniref:PDZ domain-containing protein n=1 Tax=Cyclostephanos tholiformis TaxID=382380 RepID=A0ABD3RW72_9STRA